MDVFSFTFICSLLSISVLWVRCNGRLARQGGSASSFGCIVTWLGAERGLFGANCECAPIANSRYWHAPITNIRYWHGQRADKGHSLCKRTSEESGKIGGRKEKELVDDDLTTGKHPTI